MALHIVDDLGLSKLRESHIHFSFKIVVPKKPQPMKNPQIKIFGEPKENINISMDNIIWITCLDLGEL